MEVGPVEPAGMGSAPISWRSIRAWRQEAGVILTSWDARMLRRLSSEYLIESQAAEDPGRPSPWERPITQAERDANEMQLRSVLG